MVIEHTEEKLYNSIIYFLKNIRNCDKTKLFKLLYYSDFFHFRETGKSITGEDYYSFPKGPYPCKLAEFFHKPSETFSSYIDYIDDNTIIPKKDFDETFFTRRELRILEEINNKFKDTETKDIVEMTHLPNEPWDKTKKTKGEKELIDYMLAVDNTSNSLSREEIEERIKDRRDIIKALDG